ncbi:MAG: hypothetical protein ASARMPRED_008009 [Alectoria sarmentosa]|nr:MAG: hypothetical protein ASARMPRED_008009 [Alectoria sarmentosa]
MRSYEVIVHISIGMLYQKPPSKNVQSDIPSPCLTVAKSVSEKCGAKVLTKNPPRASSSLMEGKTQSRKPKIIFNLDTPYTDVQWPVVSADKQTKILDMLCSLLSPIGEHRSRNVAPSKGKRAKKRKRKDDLAIEDHSAACPEGRLTETGALAPPEIHDHLTIGFNTTTRYLELLAQKSNPSTVEHENSGAVIAMKTCAQLSLGPANIKPLAAVFIPRSGQSSVLYSHMPPLMKAASLAVPSSPSTRIVILPEGAEDRLKTVLRIPRVGMVGLIDCAPDASSLIEFIRQNVSELEVPWLQEAIKGVYLALKINAIQTSAPT